ncbi:hypothetical protein T06_11181 [Trichinella sp. T6]|nr:hypothetical protein T06_11181 [Trichinella sp. T6]
MGFLRGEIEALVVNFLQENNNIYPVAYRFCQQANKAGVMFAKGKTCSVRNLTIKKPALYNK